MDLRSGPLGITGDDHIITLFTWDTDDIFDD